MKLAIGVGYGMWRVLVEMAPWLLFGFLMAGVVSVVLSPRWIERHLGRRGLLQIFKAALFGIPMPLCSCSVIPVTAGLRRGGAGRGAAISFLTATPQTGVDSIAVTWSLLGGVFTAFRVTAALVSGMVCGLAVERFDSPAEEVPPEPEVGCCRGGEKSSAPAWRRMLEYGFSDLPRDIGRALLFGIFISALMGALIPENWFADLLAPGLGMMLVMLLLGIPVYVCSTASIPIAVMLMRLGVTPGAALVFLIAGPATNAATVSTVWNLFGRRTAVIYLISIAFCALFSGFLMDFLPLGEWVTGQLHEHAPACTLCGQLAAVLLLVMLIRPLLVTLRDRKTPAD